jgi:urea carboxylase
MFKKVLIANRGVIARRIIRTLRKLGVSPVAVYSEADRHSPHVSEADEAVLLGPPPAAESYLNQAAILTAAHKTGADAIHPGYGFLSENASFAEACEKSGLVFLGPTPQQMRALGLKHAAREIASRADVPVLPGTGLLLDLSHALEEAERCGYPVILKSTAGGGGIGMRICRTADEMADNFSAAVRLSSASFGQAGVYLEQYVERARHIEVQIFGDGAGNVIALGERDCSAQRRNQKVIEETPAPGLQPEVRQRLWETAERLTRALQYRSAGTVEFLYDSERERFFFLEVNTRLQVEHAVTEEVTGIDIVEWMVRLAAGELSPLGQLRPKPRGVSIQVRIYAEDPAHAFRPSTGILTHVRLPRDVRCETWVENGTEVTPFYDPMLAKIIVRGDMRDAAVHKLREALAVARFDGLETNLDYLRRVIAEPEFSAGGFPTTFLNAVVYRPNAMEVLEAGTQTTIQDYPGRLGYWHVGVPPSGPMDMLAFQIANRLVGNPETAAALECTMSGPSLRFHADAVIAITGADMRPMLDGKRMPHWQSVEVHAGSTLQLGTAADTGSRAYIAVRGGLDVPTYLDSRATFILGKFGGHAGRTLRPGDMLRWGDEADLVCPPGPPAASKIPHYSHDWEIGVMYGPHGAPDFFTHEDIETLFAAQWKVHYNSDRTGVRLIGPRPKWARKDGGEAGLHPSNLHDNAYAIGAMDFTGDMPVILGPDGPSLGGFVCPLVVVDDELWKLGQLRPGDTVRFVELDSPESSKGNLKLDDSCISNPKSEISESTGRVEAREVQSAISDFGFEMQESSNFKISDSSPRGSPILHQRDDIVYRASGDRYLLIEIGPNVLDLNLRFRVHQLERLLRQQYLPGIIDITPGIRSLQVHYDGGVLSREALIACLEACESEITDLENTSLPIRTIHLPLSWDDPATQLAIRKYMQSVRPDAPWCPSNIEFIRRINGLNSIEDVRRIVFNADYLVLGLGDVYLGAPVATPVDPRHRLVTTKYNPARTWTAENSVGIGGAYLCVYGMEGPGGYQFVGRTVQMWNTYRSTPEFRPGHPWLLRFFDQIRFFPVSAQELLEIRDAFPHGKYSLDIEHTNFSLKKYRDFMRKIADESAEFKARQQAAFIAERERWAAAGQPEFVEPPDTPPPVADLDLPDGCEAVRSPISASVWQIAVEPGQRVGAGERIVILEAMKMEFVVVAPADGVVEVLHCRRGGMVIAGQMLARVRVE